MTTITVTREREKSSSIIEDIHYNYETETMIITFVSNGERYQYKNIDENLFEKIINAKSLGGFLVANVFTNPKYKYEIL